MLYWTQGSTHDSTTVPGPRVYAWSNQKIMRILGSGGLGWKSLEELLRFIESAHFCRRGWIEGTTIRTIFKLQLWKHHENNAYERWASSVDFVKLDGLPLQSFHHQMESKSIPWSHSYWLPLNLTDYFGHWGISLLLSGWSRIPFFKKQDACYVRTMEILNETFMKAVWTCWGKITTIKSHHVYCMCIYIYI